MWKRKRKEVVTPSPKLASDSPDSLSEKDEKQDDRVENPDCRSEDGSCEDASEDPEKPLADNKSDVTENIINNQKDLTNGKNVSEGDDDAPTADENISNANDAEEKRLEKLLLLWSDRPEGCNVSEFLAEFISSSSPEGSDNAGDNLLSPSDNEFMENLRVSLRDILLPDLEAEPDSDCGEEGVGGNAKNVVSSWSKPLELVLNLATDLSEGIIDRDLLRVLKKGCLYDADVESARAAGEIAGRNIAIVSRLNEDEAEKGDGVPVLSGAFSAGKYADNSIFDLARSARI